MSLQAKVLQLKLEAAMANRVACGWQKLIDVHGEAKATQFYSTHLGLNHLEKKSYDWEGMTLSREPKEHEKIAVKGVSQAQESAKESISKILLGLRSDLISDGLNAIKKLKPANYHTLTLQVSADNRTELRDRLIKTHKQGRILVANELGKKAADPEDDEFDDLDTLTDTTDGRVVNDVQSRLVETALRYATMGVAGAALWSTVAGELNSGSVTYIDRTAGGVANRVISIGRYTEMRNRADEIGRYEYSCLLDVNSCEPCAADDGKEASSPDDLPSTPNVDCAGSDLCRCFIVAVMDTTA